MKLTSKLSIAMLLLLFFVCLGMYIITVHNERAYFVKQLNSNARDTATSLGLSLSQAMAKEERAFMLPMVQAVFDRGRFYFIRVVNMKNEPIVSRYVLENVNTPPAWFKKLMPINTETQRSIIMSGWRQVGKVEVMGDPSWAYLALWKNALALLYWYIILAVLVLLITFFFVQWLLRPLQRITEQAKAICRGTFPIETTIPTTPEFRHVTKAMNRMVIAVREIFERQLKQIQSLQKQNYTDPLTGLGNRKSFLQQLHSYLQQEDDFMPGYLVLIAIDGLDALNKHHGYSAGDDILKAATREIMRMIKPYKSIQLMRISGSQFAVIVRFMDQKQFEVFLEELNKSLQTYFNKLYMCSIYISAASFRQFETGNDLLARTDHGLGEARNRANHLNFITPSTEKNIRLTHALIDNAFENKKFILFYQDVKCKDVTVYKEIFVRLTIQNKILQAGFFMPYIEKQKYATAIDCYVLDCLGKKLHSQSKDIYSVNVSGQTILDFANRRSYVKKLNQLSFEARKKLVVEINELYLINYFNDTSMFIDYLSDLSIKVAVDHVGAHFSVLDYIKNLSFEYLKIDGMLLQDILNNEYKQFYILYFSELAKTIGIKLIATQVESDTQWKLLESMNIHCIQGNYIAPCRPLKQHAVP